MTTTEPLTACPLTGATTTEHLATYERSVTSDNRLIDAPVENRISHACGLVYNATGARGGEADFYMDDYDLHAESAISEFMTFDQGGTKGIYDNIVEFIEEGTTLPARGRLLDVGCGKGLLLKRFRARYADWEICAVEPSRNATSYFREVMPEVTVFEGLFEDSPYVDQEFDLITANGVLEHVPDPVDFGRRIRSCLGDHGAAYLGVPNFANNPADLFTWDHLSRFTPETVRACFDRAGLDVAHAWVLPTRVPMWHLVRAGAEKELDATALYEPARAMVDEHLAFVQGMFDACDRCAAAAREDGGRVGMYATGTIGLLASVYTDLEPAMLAGIYDDNRTIWGSRRMGCEIRDPARMLDDGIDHVVISANPCYFDAIRRRIRDIAGDRVKVHAP